MINKVHVEWGATNQRHATGYGDPEGYGRGVGMSNRIHFERESNPAKIIADWPIQHDDCLFTGGGFGNGNCLKGGYSEGYVLHTKRRSYVRGDCGMKGNGTG